MNLTIIIPCYNERDRIETCAQELRPVLAHLRSSGTAELIFVDDGSTDGTFNRLTEVFADLHDVTILRHGTNLGPGAALRTGFAHARGDVIVTTDSDGTYPFDTIPDLLSRLTPTVDIATASPYHPQGGVAGVPAYRLFFSAGASFIYRALLDPAIHTYTAMYRAYRREVIEQVETHNNGFLMFTELLVGAMLAGYHVAEFPTILRVRRYGQSKARIARITAAHLHYQSCLLGWRILPLLRRKNRRLGRVL